MNPNGPYIQTYTGRRFYLFDLRREMICIEDIAHALSNQCRFSGHCPYFYSVAEHSIRVAELTQMLTAAKSDISGKYGPLQGLLHDASEAYMIDLPQPWKRQPKFAAFKAVESMLQYKIFDRFSCPPEMFAEVKAADEELLTAESMVFWPEKAKEWETWRGTHTYRLGNYGLYPDAAKRLFLEAFTKYGGKS